MDERTLRERFFEIAKNYLKYAELWNVEVEELRREILTLASINKVSLGAEIHVEMVDMMFWYWENVLKVPKQSIMSNFNGYSLYLEGEYNLYGLLPEKDLIDNLIKIDEYRGLIKSDKTIIVNFFRAHKNGSDNINALNYFVNMHEVLKLRDTGVDFDWVGYQTQMFRDPVFLDWCSDSYYEAAQILNNASCGWKGQPFSWLMHTNYVGFTGFYLEHATFIEIKVASKLIVIDEGYQEFCHKKLVHQFWRKLNNNSEVLNFLLERIQDKLYIDSYEILNSNVPEHYFGQSIERLNEKGFSGYAHYFLYVILKIFDQTSHGNEKRIPSIKTKIKCFFQLVDIDEKYGTRLGTTIWASWNLLTESNRNVKFLKILLKESNTRYAKAAMIMMKFKDNERFTAGFHCNRPRFVNNENKATDVTSKQSELKFGYTATYLKFSYDEGKSLADLSELTKLVIMDLQEGETLAELLYTCCKYFPKKLAIEKILKIGTIELSTNQIKKLAEELLSCQSKDGLNCFSALFQSANHFTASKAYASNQEALVILVRHIENSFHFLMKWGKQNDVDMCKVLNSPSKEGSTFLSWALRFSSSITKSILDLGVKVNSIDIRFVTPFMKVSPYFFF